MARKRKRIRGTESGGISRRQAVGGLLLGGAALAGIQQTGAFDVVMGDRPFSVGTGADDAALLGITTQTISGQDGESVDIFELTNNADGPFSFVNAYVVQAPAGGTVSSISTPPGLDVGQSAMISGELVCEFEFSGQEIILQIEVGGESGRISAERAVPISCEVDVFDPFDCHDVISAPADIMVDSPLVMRGNDLKEGHVAMDEQNDAFADLGGNAVIEGFLRVKAGTNAFYDIAVGTPRVEGAVVLIAGNDVIYDDRGTALVEGDLCIRAGSNANVDMRGTTEVGGHIDIEAGQSVNMDVRGDVLPGEHVQVEAANGNIVLELRGDGKIHGDVYLDANWDVNVTLQGNVTIDGDLCVNAGGNFNFHTRGQGSVTGDVSENC